MRVLFLVIAAVILLFVVCGLRNGYDKVTQKVGWRKTPAQKLKLSGQKVIEQLGGAAKTAGKVAEPFAKAGAQELARQHPRTGVDIVNKGLKKIENWGTEGKPQQDIVSELRFKAGNQIVAVDPEGRVELIAPTLPGTLETEETNNGVSWVVWVLAGVIVVLVFVVILFVRSRRTR